MDAENKHVSIGEHRVYGQELIYARAIGLLTSSREINFDDVLAFAAYPPSMFSEEGKMRTAKSKSSLKQLLQVCVSERNCPPPDVVIYDVSAVLWAINWTSGKLQNILDVFRARIEHTLRTADVVLQIQATKY